MGGLPPKPLRPRTLIARRLRRDSTDAEKLLWRALRESGLPYNFRRQHPVGRRVVDFACPAQKLAIELDGGQHDTNSAADAERTAELGRHGYRVIRFWNNEVMGNIEGVMTVIRDALERTPPLPDPLRPHGAEGE